MADRYPVIAGTWDGSSAAIWAATKGGVAGSASAPTAGDNVFLDFAGAGFSVTVAAGAVCNDLTIVAPGSGNFTLTGSGAIAISGSLAFYSSLTYSYTGPYTFNATGTGKTITTAGKTINSAMTFNGSGGGWSLSDSFTSASSITLTQGTLNTNGQTVSITQLVASGSALRTLTLGSSTVTVTLPSSGAFNLSGTNITFNADTSTVILQHTAGGFANLTLGARTFNNLTLRVTTAYGAFQILSSGATISGAFEVTGANANTQRAFLFSDTHGATRTFTCNGTITAPANVDFRDIVVAGTAAPAVGTSLGDCGGCSGITMTTPATRYWVGDSGNLSDTTHWSTLSGGLSGASVPLPQDTAVFDGSSFSTTGRTVTNSISTVAGGFRVGSLNWSAATNAPTFTTSNSIAIYGSYTLASGVILSGSGALVFSANSAQTLTFAGRTLNNFTVDVASGSLTLQDVASVTGAITHSSGTLNTNSQAVSSSSYVTSGSIASTLTLGSTTWTLTGTGTVWSLANPSLTLTANTATLKTTDTSASSKTFAGGGRTYGTLWFSGAGSGTFIVTGSNTFAVIKGDTGAAHTLNFTASTTTTFADWQIAGSAGNVWTISSATAANHTLRYTGTVPISVDYLSVSRSQASPGYKLFAGTHSTDGGNNAGWIFAAPGANRPQLLS